MLGNPSIHQLLLYSHPHKPHCTNSARSCVYLTVNLKPICSSCSTAISAAKLAYLCEAEGPACQASLYSKLTALLQGRPSPRVRQSRTEPDACGGALQRITPGQRIVAATCIIMGTAQCWGHRRCTAYHGGPTALLQQTQLCLGFIRHCTSHQAKALVRLWAQRWTWSDTQLRQL